MNTREQIKDAKRIVVKVGTSTLLYPNGKINLYRIEHLARELSDLASVTFTSAELINYLVGMAVAAVVGYIQTWQARAGRLFW